MAQPRPPAKAPPATAADRSRAMLSYLALYRASPLERIKMIKLGVRATEAKRIIGDLAMGQGATLKALNLSAATVNKKAKENGILSPDESERVIGVAKLVGQAQAMMQESGDPEGPPEAFDVAAWLSGWLRDPLPAFGGARPIELMDTMEGQALVSRTLAQLQTGAYA